MLSVTKGGYFVGYFVFVFLLLFFMFLGGSHSAAQAVLGKPSGVLGIEPGSSVCNANDLPAVLSL